MAFIKINFSDLSESADFGRWSQYYKRELTLSSDEKVAILEIVADYKWRTEGDWTYQDIREAVDKYVISIGFETSAADQEFNIEI